MNSDKEAPVKKKIKINKVTNRFLPLTESVINGLEPEATIKDFTILSTIGEGSFGKVFLVSHNKTKSKYAIKIKMIIKTIIRYWLMVILIINQKIQKLIIKII